MNHPSNPPCPPDALGVQLAEVRALNRRLELAQRELGHELTGARNRIAELEREMGEANARALHRIGQLEQELRAAQAAPRPFRYRLVDGCVRALRLVPLASPFLRLVKRGLAHFRRG